MLGESVCVVLQFHVTNIILFNLQKNIVCQLYALFGSIYWCEQLTSDGTKLEFQNNTISRYTFVINSGWDGNINFKHVINTLSTNKLCQLRGQCLD